MSTIVLLTFLTFGKKIMIIRPLVSEMLGEGGTTPTSDASKLQRAGAINGSGFKSTLDMVPLLSSSFRRNVPSGCGKFKLQKKGSL